MLSKFVLMLVIVAALVGGLSYTKYHQIQEMKAKFSVPQPPTAVAVARAKVVAWQKSIAGTGTLTALQDVAVTNEVPGIVAALHFESGQQVHQGDPLVTLESSVDHAELTGLIAEKNLTEVQFERAAKLVRDHTMAQSQYDETAARRDRAAADVLAKQAQIAKKTIRAPFNGTLGIRKINLGQYLKVGAGIVQLQLLNPIYLDSAVPERFLPQIRLGQEVSVRVQAYGKENFSGRITAIESGIDPATRMVRVRADLLNSDLRLRPGMFAEVEAIEADSAPTLVVPETAITYSPYGNTVFVVSKTADGLTVERKQIETGEARDGLVAISKGLAAGEQVVSVGQNKLRNGLNVTIVSESELEAPAK